jgi:demethylmenaquinone methyltransferase/2-methoxy-6-polyprenyl-1,4-benzoquinol methylase
MFGRIACRYDLLNRVLSLGQDLGWRRRVGQRVAAFQPDRLLDVCTGTGDLALDFSAVGAVYGSDFCLPMLERAGRKAKDRGRELPLIAADALRLPMADGTVDVVTVAFGVRNFEDLDSGLRELVRVLRPGGRLLVLEFSQPSGPAAPILRAWVRLVPPLVGRLVSGDPEAYAYLTASVGSFPDADEMTGVLGRAGLGRISATALTGGVATLYEGAKEDR